MDAIIDGEYSVYKETLIFMLDNITYDISELVSDWVWNVGRKNFPLHPNFDWEIRKRLHDTIVTFIKEEIDPNMNKDEIQFLG